MTGRDLLCGIDLQKSNYGDVYYVNYYYFIGNFENVTNYPTHYESDIQGRIVVMSKKQSFQGKQFMTPQIEYEEYTEDASMTVEEKMEMKSEMLEQKLEQNSEEFSKKMENFAEEMKLRFD